MIVRFENQHGRVRQLTAADLAAFLAKPDMRELIVRVVEGRMEAGVHRVCLLAVDQRIPGGPFWIDYAELDDRGPADAMRVTCPGQWREEFAGCHRIRIPAARWRELWRPRASRD